MIDNFVARIIDGVGRIATLLSKRPANVHTIVCVTGLHRETVLRYLKLIETIQATPKLRKEIQGVRVVFRMDV